jgi:multidrug efflux pump subunit AcrA (membrane-fusion protein)
MITSTRRRRRRWIGGLVAVAAIAGTGTVVVATAGGSASSQAPAGGATATITSRDLVQTDDQPGTLGYGTAQTTYSPLGGTATWLPAPGDVIRPDHRLFSLDGAPVVLMNGSFPMYRALSEGVTDGPDVKELNADLIAYGYDPYHEISPGDDDFTTGTADAVDRWEQAHGLTQDGQVALGRMVFLPGRQRVDSLSVALQQSLGGSSSGGSGSSSGTGSSGGAATAVLSTTSDQQVATVQLDASRQTEAVIGERVYVTLPSSQILRGVITDVGRVAQTSSSSGSSSGSSGSSSGGQGNGGNSTSGAGSAPTATIPVTIRLVDRGELRSLDQAPVTVAFALTTTRNALSIPVSALLATAGGGYAVDVVGAGGTVSRVPVTPGSFASGYVQISGPGIAAGMQVRDTAGG